MPAEPTRLTDGISRREALCILSATPLVAPSIARTPAPQPSARSRLQVGIASRHLQ